MKERPLIDLGMTGYDELFMNDAERREVSLPKIYTIPLSEIDDFSDHPFQVRLDEDMDQLVESVKERGVITPITLRQKTDGRYEIVSGHRRRKACELAGLATVPAEIKELTRDEAIILMVESNLQRSTILPSEKAFSYKMRLEAMKRLPGRPTKENVSPLGTHLRSDEILAQTVGDSRNQINRYIRLTELIPDLLAMVDEGRIALRPAVELSYLGKLEQQDLAAAIGLSLATPSHGISPHVFTRRVLEELHLSEIVDAVFSGKTNSLGCREIHDGSDQKQMADEYKRKAKEYEVDYPITACFLKRMSDYYASTGHEDYLRSELGYL